MSKENFRGVSRKMQKSWWEVGMSYSLCLEGNSRADRSEGIIMGWEREVSAGDLFLPRISLFFPNLCEKIGPVSSYPWQVFEIVWAAEREGMPEWSKEGWTFSLCQNNNLHDLEKKLLLFKLKSWKMGNMLLLQDGVGLLPFVATKKNYQNNVYA